MMLSLYESYEFAEILLGDIHEFLHFVLAVLAVVVLEVEVLGQQAVDLHHIHQMVQVDPLGPALLVEFLLLDAGHHALAVGPDQVGEAVLGLLRVLLRALHLELDDDLLLQQEVLQILEGNTLEELLPDGQFVLILLVADGLL